jgi:hypothetical protein
LALRPISRASLSCFGNASMRVYMGFR